MHTPSRGRWCICANDIRLFPHQAHSVYDSLHDLDLSQATTDFTLQVMAYVIRYKLFANS